MTYITKTASSGVILNKLRKTFKPTDSSWIADQMSNMFWAIQAIGYHCGFIDDCSQEDNRHFVIDNRCKIPECAERIKFVEVFIDSIESDTIVIDPMGNTVGVDRTPYSNRVTVPLSLGTDITGKSIGPDRPRTSDLKPNSHYYNISGNFIITSFSVGELKLHWVELPTDEHGLPLVIDTFDYKMALFYYCAADMIAQGYKNQGFNDYGFAIQQFEMHRKKASNDPKMPSIQGMQSLEAVVTRFNLGLHDPNAYMMNLESRGYIDF